MRVFEPDPNPSPRVLRDRQQFLEEEIQRTHIGEIRSMIDNAVKEAISGMTEQRPKALEIPSGAKYISCKEAAQIARVCPKTISNWANKGLIATREVGPHRYERESLERYLRTRIPQGTKPRKNKAKTIECEA